MEITFEPRITLEQWQALVAVVDAGSYAKAADADRRAAAAPRACPARRSASPRGRVAARVRRLGSRAHRRRRHPVPVLAAAALLRSVRNGKPAHENRAD